MEQEINIFEIVKIVMFWTSPIIFVAGVVLVLYSNYKRLEELFGRQVFGGPNKLIPAIETNIYNFHEWLMERRTLIGFVCVLFAIAAFLVFR